MLTLSLCMIVKDEEEVLGRCLASVKEVVDEIIVADTGSTDNTKAVAEAFGAKVYDFPWCDDFAAARNFSFSKATSAYTLWLDADDILLPDDAERMKKLKAALPEDTDVVMLPYAASADEEGKPLLVYDRERILRTGKYQWEGVIHEVITPSGRIVYGDATVTHRKLKPAAGDRNLRIFEKKLEEGKPFSPREQYYYARELYAHERFAQAAEVLIAFLQSGAGWQENEIDALQVLSRCLQAMGREREGVYALLATFARDLPRAEVCCALGQHFFDHEDYRQAVYWYETARNCTEPTHSGAFIERDAYGFLPCIWLCVCYDRLGAYEKAREYNELAASFRPNAPEVAQNRRYFARYFPEE